LHIEDVIKRLRIEFARIMAFEQGKSSDEIQGAMNPAKKDPKFVIAMDRRVRYWSDGLIIGSKMFIKEVASRFYDCRKVEKRRLQAAVNLDNQSSTIFSWRSLRI